MNCLFSSDRESEDQKRLKIRDFYSILKIDTHIHHSQSMNGQYITEITQDMDRHIYVEWRITIYQKSISEQRKKAQWLIKNKLQHLNLRWIIQLPRLYSIYRKMGKSIHFMIDNIFRPLFEVTINPEIDPDFLDCVDDEKQHENFFLQHLKILWTKDSNQHYAYWIYYIYAYLSSLNQLRQQRGLNTLDLRPHCGLNENIDYFVPIYWLNESIMDSFQNNNQFQNIFFNLKQIGISMSPIANNKLICKNADSPFNSISDKDLMFVCPLMIPLCYIYQFTSIEDYAMAQQIFDISNVDIAELACNSVRYSSFESIIIEFYVWIQYERKNPVRNNVPQSRFLFRQETLKEECRYLQELSKSQ